MNLDDMRRLKEQCTYGAAQVTPCKTCGKEAKYVVPPDGIFCQEHLPEGTELMSFDDYLKLVKDKQKQATDFLSDAASEGFFGG